MATQLIALSAVWAEVRSGIWLVVDCVPCPENSWVEAQPWMKAHGDGYDFRRFAPMPLCQTANALGRSVFPELESYGLIRTKGTRFTDTFSYEPDYLRYRTQSRTGKFR
jgi:hypothetical protein